MFLPTNQKYYIHFGNCFGVLSLRKRSEHEQLNCCYLLSLANKRFYDFEGRKALLRHVRDDVELPEIIRDDHYDFNFQVSFTKKNELK